jgi:TonB family protein
MTRFAVPVLLMITFAGCSSVSDRIRFAQARGDVKYYSNDWSNFQMRNGDEAPYPVGGMKAYLDRLDYPREYAHIRGTVIVHVSLDASGRVLSAWVSQSLHPVLDSIVLRAVRETRWEPARRGGQAVPLTFHFPTTFKGKET